MIVWPIEIVVDGQPPPAAASETVKVWPATVMVPVRAAPVFAAAVKLMVPFPEPLLLVVIQLALLTAVQAQPVEVVTPNDPLPPLEPKLWLLGLRVYVQPLVVTLIWRLRTTPTFAGTLIAQCALPSWYAAKKS